MGRASQGGETQNVAPASPATVVDPGFCRNLSAASGPRDWWPAGEKSRVGLGKQRVEKPDGSMPSGYERRDLAPRPLTSPAIFANTAAEGGIIAEATTGTERYASQGHARAAGATLFCSHGW